MSSHACVFDLTDNILINVLSAWIDITELAFIDTTCCSKLIRTCLFNVLNGDDFYSCGTTVPLCDMYYDWLFLRKIKVKRLVLSNYNEKKIYPVVRSVLNHQLNSIESIEMRHCLNLELIVAECAKSIVSLNLFCSVEMTDLELLALTKDTVNLTEISLSACDGLSNDGIKSFLKSHRNLVTLDLSMYAKNPVIVNKICKAIGLYCPNLKKLHCPESMIDEGLSYILKGCPLLEILHLDECAFLSDDAISLVAQRCPLLRKLYASKVRTIKDSPLAQLAKCCPKLTVVDLEASEDVTFKGMSLLLKGCSQLRMLILYDCIKLSSKFVQAVATHCPLLSHLYLTSSLKLDDKCLVSLSRHCGLLQALYISGSRKVTDDALTALITNCPLLTCLNTSDTQITAEPLVASHMCVDLVHLELDASGTDYLDLPTHSQRPFDLANEDVDYSLKFIPCTTRTRVRSLIYANTDALFSNINVCTTLTQCATSLLTVKFRQYTDLTDDIINHLVGSCSRLESVSITKCPALTIAAFTSIATQCRHLTSLEIREQVMLDEELQGVLEICGKRLKHLSVQGCLQLTDVTLSAVGSLCPALTSFDMSECFLMTDRGLKHVLRNCSGLQRLALRHCEDHITEDTLNEICQVCTALRTLDIRFCNNIEEPVLGVMRLMLECPTLMSVLYYEEVQAER